MQDFATSSLKGEVVAENEENIELGDLEQYEIDSRKQWEQRYWFAEVVRFCQTNVYMCPVIVLTI